MVFHATDLMRGDQVMNICLKRDMMRTDRHAMSVISYYAFSTAYYVGRYYGASNLCDRCESPQ